jgi:hypothetical protein
MQRPGTRTKCYQFATIDNCTRLRVLCIYPNSNQKTAIQFVEYVLSRLPFGVEVIELTTVPNSASASTGTFSTRVSTKSTQILLPRLSAKRNVSSHRRRRVLPPP